MFTAITKIKGHIPDDIYDQLLAIPEIDGPRRCSNFLGQLAVECADFTRFTENLNYSVQGLVGTFPKYFKTTTAAEYARQPERIANRVYANRMGNGDEQSGDGWKYRGRGAIQLTGKDNYLAFFHYMNLPATTSPDMVATEYRLKSAAWFFTTRGLWVIADKGVDDNTITELTHKINGGEHGIEKRKEYTKKFWDILKS